MLKFLSRLWIIGMFTCGLAMPVWAQGNEMTLDDAIGGYEAATHQTFQGVPDDWSTHHVVFSRPEPGSETEYRVQQDPRYWLQQIKEKMPAAADAATSDVGLGLPEIPLKKKPVNKKSKAKINTDWSENMGTGAKVGPGQYPAKFSLSPNSTPNCTTDYVVYNTGLAGSTTQASIVAYNNLYKTTCSTVPTVDWAYNTGGTIDTAVALSIDGSQIAFIQSSAAAVASLVLLKWHANTTGRTVTGSLSTTSPDVTITSGTFTQADVGAQISGTDIPTGDTIASVLSGTTANLATAPTATHASETLTIKAEAIATPGVPPTVATTAYPTCTAPCMTTIAFADGHNDTNSFPFYDYSGGDLLFAGDDSGDLHKFQHAFNGTASTPPAEVTTGGFPATVSATGLALSTPVYDSNSHLAFVGEAHVNAATTDGKFHSVSSTGTVLTSGPAADALCHGVGLTEGALLDPSATVTGATIAGTLYIGCDHDDGGDTCGTGNNACLRQFAESGISGGIGSSVNLGLQADAEMYAGAFDHPYLLSSAPTGNLYFCGNPAGEATLYRIPITANVMGTPVAVHALSTTTSTAGTEGSPVTEFYNTATSTDWLFVSEPNTPAMNTGVCTGTGCVYSFNATTALAAGTAATDAIASEDGSSGIVVDNGSSTTGASNVYFSTLGNQACTTSGGTGGCAIQAAQSNLSD